MAAVHDHRRNVQRVLRRPDPCLRVRVDVRAADAEHAAEDAGIGPLRLDADRVVRRSGGADDDVRAGDIPAVLVRVAHRQRGRAARVLRQLLGPGERRGVRRSLEPALRVEPVADVEDEGCHAEQHDERQHHQHNCLAAFVLAGNDHSTRSFMVVLSRPLATTQPSRLMS